MDAKDIGEFRLDTQLTYVAVATVVAMLVMIALPLFSKLADEHIGYVFLILGGAVLAFSMSQGVVEFHHGEFVQKKMTDDPEGLHHILGEPKILLLVFFSLSLLAIFLEKKIDRMVEALSAKYRPESIILVFCLVVGVAGSVSVVVTATLGGFFFRTLQKVTKRVYTISAVCYSAAIGISALLTTAGEPLSMFIAKNLQVGNLYLVKTFAPMVVINVIVLSVAAWWFAKRAPVKQETMEEAAEREIQEAEAVLPSVHGETQVRSAAGKTPETELKEALEAAERLLKEHGNFEHKLDGLLHKTVKLFCFVLGLMFFGVAMKAVAAQTMTKIGPGSLFWANSTSTFADNALLGLVEILKGMGQYEVLSAGISLALWGVGLVPGNVCNVVLKELLGISFEEWAKIGMPVAIALAVFNFVLLQIFGNWLYFTA